MLKGVPVKNLVIGALIAVAGVGFLTASPASAQPETDQDVIQATIRDGTDLICPFFATQGANGDTLNQIGRYYINKGYTPAQSAKIVSLSVKVYCKQYLPALHIASGSSG